jgi:hypothetical protein
MSRVSCRLDHRQIKVTAIPAQPRPYPCAGHARFNSALSTGNARIRVPVALKIALQIAAVVGGTPGSPTPPGGAALGTM